MARRAMFKGKANAERRAREAEEERRSKDTGGNDAKANYDQQHWWHRQKGKDAACALMATAHALTFEQLGVQTRNFRNSILYGGYGYMAGSRFSASVIPPSGPLSAVTSSQGRLGPHYNICNSATNTILARLLTNGMPHVTALTNDGDFELQHKAALLDQFIEGLMYQVDLPNVATRIALDTLVYGTGISYVGEDAEDNITIERVFPNEIWAEAWDAREQAPRTLYRVGTADRDVLAAKYPKLKDKIMALKPMHPLDQSTASGTHTNVVAKWEGWHLPSPTKDGLKGGRYVSCVAEDIILEDREWESSAFPFQFFRFSDTLTGFWGLGVCELLWGHQAALNSVTRAEYMAHSQISLPRMWADLATKINVNHLLSSRSGLVLQGSGPPPQVLNWPATTANFVEWKNWIIESAYEMLGVAKMSATGEIPAGLKSGAAIRDYMQQQDVRFTVLNQRFSRFHIEIAEALISAAKRIYEKNGDKFPVTVIGKNFLREIDWGEIDLEDEEYRLKLYETSSLPRTPSGRLAFVQELLQGNLISPDMGRKLLQFPDLDDSLGLANAAQENARFTAFQLLHDDGPPPVPDPLQNVPLCVTTVTQEALKALNNKAPEWRIQRCRDWLEQARILIQPPPPPPQAGVPGGAPMPPPQAAPAPPPQSDLLPNQPSA